MIPILKNKRVIILGIILLLFIGAICYFLSNKKEIQVIKNNTQIFTNGDLCKTVPFSSPTNKEIKYLNEIAQDSYVKYLRLSLDRYISSGYGENNQTVFSKIEKDYLKSKFIVLQTDTAPRGGESIVFIFKDRPDKVFFAWVYGEMTKQDFDLREVHEYDSIVENGPTILETQKRFSNQICTNEVGI